MDAQLDAHLEFAALSDTEFLDRSFRIMLRRLPYEEAREYVTRALASYGLSRAALLEELVASDEFRRLRILDDAVAEAASWRSNHGRPRRLVASAEFDPRPIEFIWTLGRYRSEPRVLDVGYAFADPAWIVGLLGAGPAELFGVDLVRREVPGLTAVVADVRELPFDQDRFDVAFCISTIEHAGADNTRYGLPSEDDRDGPLRGLVELNRVTATDGRVLLTVPCSDAAEDWYVRQPRTVWLDRFREAGLAVVEWELYVEQDGVWRSGDGEAGLLCAELAPDR